MRFLLPIFLLSCLSFPGFAQTTSQDSSKPAPQLDHFDAEEGRLFSRSLHRFLSVLVQPLDRRQSRTSG